jgi:hypothetical protein
MGRTRFTGLRPLEDGQGRRQELSGGGDEEGGPVHRICVRERSLAVFVDQCGDLHF